MGSRDVDGAAFLGSVFKECLCLRQLCLESLFLEEVLAPCKPENGQLGWAAQRLQT